MRIVFVALAAAAGLIAIRRDRRMVLAVGFAWVAALMYVAFLMRQPYAAARAVFDPFHALKLFLENRRPGFLEGAALNLLIFIPVGYTVPVLFRRADRWWKVLLIGFFVSLVVEILQLISRLGMFDLDDLMHNVIGTFLGWGCYWKWIRERKDSDRRC